MSTSLVNLIDFSLRLVDDAQSENAHSCIFAEVDFHIRFDAVRLSEGWWMVRALMHGTEVPC